jgi:signal transduction histidine kinase
MPFEEWVRNISNLGAIESNANGFVEGAMQEMLNLPWVSGVTWSADNAEGEIGTHSQHTNNFNSNDLQMTLYSRWEVSPALYVHIKLLTQVMGEFYDAKRREETMRQNAYMQAFYESGSRLTHDIKNILQSVGTLVSAAEEKEKKDDDALLKLIRRQLPMLNQRIGATLNKLLAPGEEKKRVEKISAWWKALQLRHHQAHIEFIANVLPPLDINAEVLDSVIDNLISNATEKAKHEPNTQITVALYQSSDNGFSIDVTDTGKAINANVVQDLFKKHISSQNGMGVGLYHAAHDAKQAGYALSLASNETEAVCFRLALKTN